MKKSVIAILTATIIMLSTLTPLLYVQPARAVLGSDPTSWYMTVPGVLNTDTYSLYPYSNQSLSIGISQFGEMIDPYTGIGLMYGSADPFVNEQFIPQFEWNQGWLINLTYSYTGEYRNVWAFALYSDSYNDSSIGGNWVQAPSPDSTTVVGGRKYGGMRWNNGNPVQIGYATTAPFTVLYNSPREFVGIAKNTIGEDVNTPLVGVSLTFVFDKVKKYVTVYKDVKLLDTRKFAGNMQVEFSNRGEWDLGLTTAPPSFADFFDNISTSYAVGYQPFYNNGTGDTPLALYNVAQVLSTNPNSYVGFAAYWPSPISESMLATALTTRTLILSSMSTFTADFIGNGTNKNFVLGTGANPPAISYPRGQGVWSSDPMVFVNGQTVPEDSIAINGWTWNPDTQTVSFNNAPGNGASVWIIYKHRVYNPELVGEPAVPYIFAEWDFDLNHKNDTGSTNMFRAVTVYGVTDNHDGSDALFPSPIVGTIDTLDREVTYQLDQVFNPFDLTSAVEKSTSRWVWFGFPELDGDWTSTTPSATQSSWPNIAQSPVLNVGDSQWDQYNQFAERIIDLNTSSLCYRTSRANDFVMNTTNLETYDFSVDANGVGHITGLDPTHYYKILYSTNTHTDMLTFDLTHSVTGLNSTQLTTPFAWGGVLDTGNFLDQLNVQHDVFTDDFNFNVMNFTSVPVGNFTWTYTGPAIQWEANPFIVPNEATTELETGAQNFETVNVTGAVPLQFNIQNLELDWEITPPMSDNFMNLRYVYVNNWDFDVIPTITVTYGNSTAHPGLAFSVAVSISFVPDTIDSNLLFTEDIPGRYELGVVGKNAATVDSAGLSMISAAMKDKGYDEYGIAAEDMYDPMIANQMPWVMSKIGQGTSVSDYYYGASDLRTALKDDWCTTWPVSSANLVGSGGPLANLLAYYSNDFETAFYGLPQFTNAFTPWYNAIVPLSCWNATHEGYADTNTTGYAVISTYIDLNGTEVLMVWGNWGRDTYYASQWFYMDGINEFQHFPAGVNSIVLQINYKSYPEGYKPTLYTVKEMLGSISETGMYDSSAFMTSPMKGGIHPDP